MMILGLGNDIIDIRRVERTIERYGDRFSTACSPTIERMKSDGRAMRAASYAKRFAAKEACAKALGTGLRHGVFWRDMGVVNLPSGRPTMELTGGALKALVDLTQRAMTCASTSPSPMTFPWRRRSSSSRPSAFPCAIEAFACPLWTGYRGRGRVPESKSCTGELPHER